MKGSFAPLGKFHSRIESDFNYDASIGRFTPKNPMGAAAETLDALHAAKDDAEKSGLYKKMASGDPNDLFEAAEEYGKVFAKLAEGVLRPSGSCRPIKCWSSRPSRRCRKRPRRWRWKLPGR